MSFLEQTQDFVKDLFEKHPNPHLLYHNLEHTQTVVSQCKIACSDLKLSAEDTIILLVSAWLHDIGYLFTYQNHEAKSIEIATPFLMSINFPHIDEVKTCIEATQIDITPQNETAALLKDIDAAYGLYTNFEEKGNLLRLEWALTIQLTFIDMKWINTQQEFLKKFHWFSNYGSKNFQQIIEEWVYKIDKRW